MNTIVPDVLCTRTGLICEGDGESVGAVIWQCQRDAHVSDPCLRQAAAGLPKPTRFRLTRTAATLRELCLDPVHDDQGCCIRATRRKGGELSGAWFMNTCEHL